MFSLAQDRPQTSNYQIGSLARFGMRLLAMCALSQLTERSATNVVNQVSAFNQDKVKFQVFEIDSPLRDIVWCGNTNDVILVLSLSGTVYRSRDRGESWKKLHSYMHQTGQSVLEDGQTDIGNVKKIVQSPVDDSLVVFTGTNGINWVTEDCGQNLRALNSGKKIHEFNFHPLQRQWALAAGWTSCEDFGDDEPCQIYKELYVTKDLGQSWQYLKSYVFDFSWGMTKYASALPQYQKYSESRIFITSDPDLKGHQKTREKWKESVHLYYSDDFFKSEKQALAAGNSIVMTQHYMFVAKAISKTHIMIHASRAEEGFLKFRRIRTPKDYHMTDHFTVMDTGSKTVFLYCSNSKTKLPTGQLFISDSLGYRFTHSMENIVKGSNAVDFEAVESMDGTFMANRYDARHGTLAKGEKHMGGITEEAMAAEEQRLQGKTQGGKMSNPGQSDKQAIEKKISTKSDNDPDFMKKIKTYMTHNKGAEWSLIRAPEVDLRGKPTNCYLEDHCSLHIQMFSHNFDNHAPPYSQPSAIGIVMAVGNIGDKMSIESDERKGTFLSRDGGYTWSEIAKIPLIYEMGDHGALLVAAPNSEPTKQIRYSFDEGKTWNKLQVSDVNIFVDNIIIEPKSTAQEFVIYGSYDNSTEESAGDISDDAAKLRQSLDNEGLGHLVSSRGMDLMISIDFSSLHEPQCKGVESAGSEKSDFELWSPHDDGRHGTSNKCFLGQQVTYVRRKQTAECFNGEELERQTMRVPCLCTNADYECDVDYVKDAGGQCVPVQPIKEDGVSIMTQSDIYADCKAENFYYVTKGYRKIPGNKCYGGVQLDPVKKPCNSFAMASDLLGGSAWIVIAGVCGGAYFFWPQIEPFVAQLPIPDPKEKVEQVTAIFSAIFATLMGLVGGATSAAAGASSSMQGGAAGYESNLDAAPEAYLNNDSDDEDPEDASGKDQKVNFDNDSSNEEEAAIPVSAGGGDSTTGSELIDLGDSSAPSVAKKIPKLSGPGK